LNDFMVREGHNKGMDRVFVIGKGSRLKTIEEEKETRDNDG